MAKRYVHRGHACSRTLSAWIIKTASGETPKKFEANRQPKQQMNTAAGSAVARLFCICSRAGVALFGLAVSGCDKKTSDDLKQKAEETKQTVEKKAKEAKEAADKQFEKAKPKLKEFGEKPKDATQDAMQKTKEAADSAAQKLKEATNTSPQPVSPTPAP